MITRHAACSCGQLHLTGFPFCASDKTFVLKEPDGLAWGIQCTCRSAQKSREAINPLRNDVTTASQGIEVANGLTRCLPNQTFNGHWLIYEPF